MRSAYSVRAAIVLIALASVVGCSGSDEAAQAHNCDVLGEQCHGLSDPIAKECHDIGHAGDEAQCTARKAECVAVCTQGGTGASSSGTGGSGGSAVGVGGAGGGRRWRGWRRRRGRWHERRLRRVLHVHGGHVCE